MALHYILDGYNIINKISYLRDKELRQARTDLIQFIEIHRPHGSLRNEITLVFDGSEGVGYNFDCSHSVRVVFTRNEKADDFIKNFVDKTKNVKSICVVSDDKDICFHCRACGSKVIGVDEFMKKKPETNKGVERNQGCFKVSAKELNKINEELRSIWLK